MTKKITPAEWKISPELAETVETTLSAIPDEKRGNIEVACGLIAANLIFDIAAKRNNAVEELAADFDAGVHSFSIDMNQVGASRLNELPAFKTCNTCRYWSELIARAGGGTDNADGDTEALCLGAGPNKGQYTTAQKTCPAWAVNAHGAVDDPNAADYPTETKQ